MTPRARRLARHRVLLTGDAAGLVDPVTCEGISNAIHSALLAADAVVRHRDQPQRVHRAYHRALRSEILPELRLARALARLFYGFPRLRNVMFRRAGASLCQVFGQIGAGQETYRSLLGRPTNYSRLLRRLLPI